MQRILGTILMTAAIVSMPILVLAQDSRLFAGTDEFLRSEVGLTDEQLSTPVDTVDRQPFELTSGEQTLSDPLGDVLDRQGATSQIQVPYGDIRSVSVERNNETQTWDVSITTGGLIPDRPSVNTQFFVYADRDQDLENNEYEGIKNEIDAEFSVKYDFNNNLWVTTFRWFNPPPVDFWARNLTTESTFSFESDTFFMQIPYSELPSDFDPNWRVVVAVADGGFTQIDAVPGIGFPPPQGEEYPESDFVTPEDLRIKSLNYVLIGLGALIVFYSLWLVRRRIDEK